MAVTSGKLPVWLTAANAYVDTFSGAATLLRVAIIPFCLIFFAGLAIGFVAGFTGHAAEMINPWSAWNVVGGLVQWFFTAVFAVAWHRYVLLPPERV